MSRITVTHLSLTLQGDADARALVAYRIVTGAHAEARRHGVQVSVSNEDEVVEPDFSAALPEDATPHEPEWEG